ncbi:TPA: dihydroxyacetone kinase subunit DhaM [Yersinia enterocolitica]|uniref:phosphoenolpyruvate--glycerone phosphotransferase n=1 Tax=Yersinia enterocolitica W22703 TaxID=913028 RepID=F4N642_YEREN|nr:dihydroxyacetone kinase phosphoryl donor subunit DhaM [Yersinia enterocolitica]CBX73550.1 PTS-dependent dihydroxyacetone kinase,phosphotransferase subunit dhaM [Yersinia enterocolitica W22703]ADZ41051.1 dihydroxyacetone kinase subunit M [Yersinia enterocolitica subsp. palearctica 105.5R(r)]AJJ29021.1 dihydroxyacetone kinase, phosphotransfer subunit [Yersinia enterocolitica]ALG80072.1 dihydroxyacetone kinase [Yersinia enterocolitica]KGA66493.1 PTS-dependent dihydroxyacetone kinase, phosphotr
MVNLVIVSHSALLAQGVAELAQQMTQGGCQLAVAAGVDDVDHPIGTDAIKVMEAIESVYSPAGVLVLMDLGSALLSAETALELLDPEMARNVQLCAAPLVEGTLAAVVAASSGASLAEVRAEAMGALVAKAAQLGEGIAPDANSAVVAKAAPDAQSVSWVVRNPNGLHVRPAAKLVEVLAPFTADLLLEKNGQCVNPRSLNQLAILQVRKGDTIRLLASGEQAGEALDAFMQLAHQHFGESVSTISDSGFTGVMVPRGAITAPVLQWLPAIPVFLPQTINAGSVANEQLRLHQALAYTVADLQQLAQQAEQQISAQAAAIFNAHAMLIDDEELYASMDKRIEQQLVCAESALQDELMSMVAAYQALTDDYLRVRELDIRDILNRVLGHLTGLPPVPFSVDREILLLAEELFPSQMIGLNHQHVKGICLSRGHILSHSAILATELDIPMLVGAVGCLDASRNGQNALLDTATGVLKLQ